MTHEEALNQILSQACGILDTDELKANGGVQEFRLDLHCAEVKVKAKYLGNLRYEIVSVEPGTASGANQPIPQDEVEPEVQWATASAAQTTQATPAV